MMEEERAQQHRLMSKIDTEEIRLDETVIVAENDKTHTKLGAPYELDSDDDEALRFLDGDDLYASDADEADARWVRKQHLPAAECEDDSCSKDSRRDYDDQGSGSDEDHDDVENATNEPAARLVTSPHCPEDADGAENGRAQQQQQGREQQAAAKGRKKKNSFTQGKALGVVTDAQLSCPLCFTTVCLECQRHARYHSQFRAVNAINVIVRDDEVLLADDVSGRSKPRSSKHKDTEKRGNSGEHEHNDRQPRPSAPADSEERARPAREGVGGTQAGEEEEFFHPVCCRECDHRVGVMDGDEVYHFFGVIASG